MRLTESEWYIMNTLWEHHPSTARELLEKLPDRIDWAYTTLKTLLSRLVAKGAVSEQKRGNTSVYEPLVTREKARRSALRSFLNNAFDGAVEPLLHFLVNDRKLTQKERRELIDFLREESSGEEKNP